VGTLCDRANRVLNGDRASVKVNVRTGFRPGSFVVDLAVVQSILQQARDFLVTDSVTAALNLAGLLGLATGGGVSLLKLIQWIRGRKPVAVTTVETGEVRIEVEVTINHQVTVEYIDVTPEVARLYNDVSVREAARDIVAPLNRPGIDVFE